MSYITVEENKCTQCGACIASCPVTIMDTWEESSLPRLRSENEPFCISCFHCETVCPTQALHHQLSETALKSAINSNKTISADELGNYMQRRRSIRQFHNKKIDRDLIEKAMEVVRYAPTGTNKQFNQWIMISDSLLIHQLAEGTVNWMRAITQSAPEMAARVNFPSLIKSWENGEDRICRNTPHIAICYTPTAYPIGIKDATIATAHLELMLPSLGIGSCWAGYLMLALQQSESLKKLIGLDESQTVHSALMLGYPKYKYKQIPARKAASITWM